VPGVCGNSRSVKLGRQDDETSGELCCLFFQFFDVSHQLIFVGEAAEVETDHFVRPLRWLPSSPQCDQHAGDDRTVCLDLNAVLVVTQQVTATQHVLEKPEEDLDLPFIIRSLSMTCMWVGREAEDLVGGYLTGILPIGS
jgi:hypothetical protein